jgi:type IV secretory pathway TraG/TraD family ATPase VirD4
MSTPPPNPVLGKWTPADLGLIALISVPGIGTVLWAGAALAAVGSGHPAPGFAPLAALLALGSPADPGSVWPEPDQMPGPGPYWAATLLTFGAAAALLVAGLRLRATRTRGDELQRLRRLPGLARPDQVTAAAGTRSLVRRAPVIRPTLAAPTAEQVGYRVGRVGGKSVWCSVEDSILLVGPPRTGKGLHLVIPWILDAPGPVVATSTRPDTLTVTMAARANRGPVAVFDPMRLTGLPTRLAWSPVRGCETPRTAFVRARGLAVGVGFGNGLSEGNFWSGQTETVLRCLLHAAALGHYGAPDLYRWSLAPGNAEPAEHQLGTHPNAAEGWVDALAAIRGADARTRDSVWLGVRQALAALGDPDVLAAVDPEPRTGFDPHAFLTQGGTLYVLASSVGAAAAGPLIAALIEDITETARTMAARSAGARLDPPLLLALDEIANLTPLPSMPSLMAEGGGSGITTLAVFQSLAQARNSWGEHAADTLWDAATVKVVLGGLAKMRDLDDISRLLGDTDQPTHTISRGRTGDRSTATSQRQLPVLPPAVLRTLPFGTAVLLLRQARPAVIDLDPWTRRPDAPTLRTGQAQAEAAIRAAHHTT